MSRGRPIKYTDEAIGNVLREYEDAKHGTRREIATRLGIKLSSLAVLVGRWRKLGYQRREEGDALRDDAGVEVFGSGDDSAPF
jgi:hypothetical protein